MRRLEAKQEEEKDKEKKEETAIGERRRRKEEFVYRERLIGHFSKSRRDFICAEVDTI